MSPIISTSPNYIKLHENLLHLPLYPFWWYGNYYFFYLFYNLPDRNDKRWIKVDC